MSNSSASKPKTPRTVVQTTGGPRMYAIASAVMLGGVLVFSAIAWAMPPGILDDLAGIMCGISVLIFGTTLLMTVAAAFASTRSEAGLEQTKEADPSENQPRSPGQRPRKAA